MTYRSIVALALAFGTFAVCPEAVAESRIALVIGNSAYQSVPTLPNPVNDAKAMADVLSAAGFEVMSAPDLTQSTMRQTIGEFAGRVGAKGADTVALVFYAGHGVQVDGENYLVPVDARIQREADVPLQALRLADLMNALAAVPSKTRIVMLDSCRNNPFSEINKVAGRGLAIVDAPTGSIVSYSTAPGSEAEDGGGANSPYTTALLNVVREPGVPIEQAFKRVRYSVHQTTNGRQTPWESSSLTGDFAFFPGEAVTKPTPPKPPAAGQVAAAPTGSRVVTRTVDSWSRELRARSPGEAYEIVIREDTVEAYQAYLALFGKQSDAPRVRQIVERRKIMIAWYTAVTINTPASFTSFLTTYPGIDLVGTAQRLLGRAQNRSLIADLAPVVAQPCLCPQPRELKRTERTRETKPTRQTRQTRGRRVIEADDQPVPAKPAGPPVVVPIGIGIGGRIPIGPGGFGGGGGGPGPIGPSGGGSHGPIGPSGGTHGPGGQGGGPLGGPR